MGMQPQLFLVVWLGFACTDLVLHTCDNLSFLNMLNPVPITMQKLNRIR